MKIDLPDQMSLVVIEPSGPSDVLSLTIAKDDQMQGMVCLTANQAAELIHVLRRAFLEFSA